MIERIIEVTAPTLEEAIERRNQKAQKEGITTEPQYHEYSISLRIGRNNLRGNISSDYDQALKSALEMNSLKFKDYKLSNYKTTIILFAHYKLE